MTMAEVWRPHDRAVEMWHWKVFEQIFRPGKL